MFDFLKKKISSWVSKPTLSSNKKDKKKSKETKKTKEKSNKVSKKEKINKKNEIKEEIALTQDQIDAENKKLTKSEKESKEEVENILEQAEKSPETDKKEEKGNFFTKLFKKITTSKLTQEDFDEIFEEFEITLLQNNVALQAVDKIKENLGKDLIDQQIKKTEAEARILQSLKDAILSVLIEPPNLIKQIKEHKGIYTMIFFGINGTGKTTSIAKIAHMLKENNISCVLAAGDTFRAAAVEQLKTHAERVGVPFVSSNYGSDPASVAFEAKKYAEQHKIKVVLIDTAGRMYTKSNLIKEMEKIIRISKPDLKMFVGESITGNDALEQCKTFNEAIGIDGIILSKADIDEKAGTILSVSHITNKPIYFLGVGQNYKDLLVFSKKEVLKNLGLN